MFLPDVRGTSTVSQCWAGTSSMWGGVTRELGFAGAGAAGWETSTQTQSRWSLRRMEELGGEPESSQPSSSSIFWKWRLIYAVCLQLHTEDSLRSLVQLEESNVTFCLHCNSYLLNQYFQNGGGDRGFQVVTGHQRSIAFVAHWCLHGQCLYSVATLLVLCLHGDKLAKDRWRVYGVGG